MAGLFCMFLISTALYALASSYFDALNDGDDSDFYQKNLVINK